jgi:tetratricopeptide (TPR) repeat protein
MPPRAANVSPDGKWLAFIDDDCIYLISKEKLKNGYDPWAEDEYRRHALAVAWHVEDAESASRKGDLFAASFHLAYLDSLADFKPGERLRCALCRLRLGWEDKGLAELANPALGRWADVQQLGWHALACIAIGDRAEYRATCGRLLSVVGSDPESSNANDAAWICCLGPAAVPDLASVEPLVPALVVALAVKDYPRDGAALTTYGAALLRAGRPAEAISKLEESISLLGQRDTAHNGLLLAIAHHQLGHADEACRWLKSAAAMMDHYRAPASACGTLGVGPLGPLPVAVTMLAKRPDPRAGKDDHSLRAWLEMDILRAEAEAVLAGTPKR